MKFQQLKLHGIYRIKLDKIEDERGFFARAWDKAIFEKNNLNSNLVQCNISFNKFKGTIRGMHYQKPPFQEAKLVRCVKGKIFEVMIDLRYKSSTYKKWISVELDENDYELLYVPEGFALGFQTLKDNTEIFYQMSQKYVPESGRGIRYDDPSFGINWPEKLTVISKKDLLYKNFNEENHTNEG